MEDTNMADVLMEATKVIVVIIMVKEDGAADHVGLTAVEVVSRLHCR